MLAAPLAPAQESNPLVGTWKLVSSATDPAGRKSATLGREPHGTLIFTADGHYSLFMARSGLPRFAANSRDRGTDDENRAVVAGTLAHTGRYAVNERQGTFTWHIEASTFPNWNNTTQVREFSVAQDELRYTSPSASATPGTALEAVWRRAK
ncbi:MAG: lipocalin-like domain-containing protein [Clostridia bacterium]